MRLGGWAVLGLHPVLLAIRDHCLHADMDKYRCYREEEKKALQFNEQQQDEADAEAWIRWRELKIKICSNVE